MTALLRNIGMMAAFMLVLVAGSACLLGAAVLVGSGLAYVLGFAMGEGFILLGMLIVLSVVGGVSITLDSFN